MSRPASRPPLAVQVAVVLFVVKYVLVPAAIGLWPTVPRTTPLSSLRVNIAVAAPILLLVLAPLSYRLWQGSKVARNVILLMAAASLVIGVATFDRFPSWWVLVWLAQTAPVATLAMLLLLPAASRAWFTSKRPTDS